jgi:hypothetical protein
MVITMPEQNTAKFVDQILHIKGYKDLVDLKDGQEPELFLQIFFEIVTQMMDALMNEPERTLSEETLKVIENDLLKVTRSLVKLRRTALGNIYKLSELEPIIDLARKRISVAIAEFNKKGIIDRRVNYIQQCRKALEEAQEKIEDFSAIES